MSTEFHERIDGLSDLGRYSALAEHLSRIPPVPERPTGISLANLDSTAAKVVEGLGRLGVPSVAFELERADVSVGSFQDDLLVRLVSRTYGTAANYRFVMQDNFRVSSCLVSEGEGMDTEPIEAPAHRAKSVLDIARFVLDPENQFTPSQTI